MVFSNGHWLWLDGRYHSMDPPTVISGTGLDPSWVGGGGLGVVTAAARHSAGEHGAGATGARARCEDLWMDLVHHGQCQVMKKVESLNSQVISQVLMSGYDVKTATWHNLTSYCHSSTVNNDSHNHWYINSAKHFDKKPRKWSYWPLSTLIHPSKRWFTV